MTQSLLKRVKRLDLRMTHHQNQLDKIRWIRLAAGITLIVLSLIFAASPKATFIGVLWVLCFFIFLYFVYQSRRIYLFLTDLQNWRTFLHRQHQRIEGVYQSKSPHTPSPLSNEEKILSRDLYLFGPTSLFEWLNETWTEGGRQALSSQLLHSHKPHKDIVNLQKIHQELSYFHWPLLRVSLASQRVSTSFSPSTLLELLKTTTLKGHRLFYLSRQVSLYLLVWALTFVFWFHPVVPWHLPLLIYLLYHVFSKSPASEAFNQAENLTAQSEKMVRIFEAMERHLDIPQLRPSLKSYFSKKPARQWRKLQTLSALLSVRTNPVAHAVVQVIFPLEPLSLYLYEGWRISNQSLLPQILEELYEFEARVSCAFFYHYQTQRFPKFSENGLHFKAHNIFHPLISRSQRVSNTFEPPTDTRLVLITGSNMSGKSTFLRTLGANQLLAQLGCPVWAESMTTFSATLGTCLQISDSLEEGYSSFYYEVKRLKSLMEKARSGESLFFLVDEIFRGTNNQERREGAQVVIKEFLKHHQCFGLISTHDLELTQLESQLPHLKNYHFRDDWKDGHLYFSYQIQNGPCPTRNALRIMHQEGLPIPQEILQNKT